MTSDLFENLQATSTDKVFNINPTIQQNQPYSQALQSAVFLRGFATRAATFDGMTKPAFSHNLDVEEYERLETITGLSGFLYGANNVGGVMNYIPKRPTSKAQNSITVGNGGGDSGYYTHIDSSGPLTQDGKLGYRLNVVSEDHDTHIENQSIERKVINLALDYKPTDNLLLQALVSDSDYRLDGRQARWTLATGVKRPDASTIDSNKLWGQKWNSNETEARRYNVNALWNINDNIDFRTAFLREEITMKLYKNTTNTIQSNGTYNQRSNNDDNEEGLTSNSAYAFFDFDFNTGSINHQLTTGVQMSENYWTYQSSDYSGVITQIGLSLDSPTYISAPKASILGSKEKEPKTKNTNFSIGDSIAFNEEWSLIAGVSYVELENTEGVKTDEITPSVSLVYKPIENLSLYTSYMEALEQGGKANDKYNGYDVSNARQQMDHL